MPGFLLSLVIVVGLMAPGTTAVAQAESCVNLESYFTTAGEHIQDRLALLLADEDWVDSFDHSSRKAGDPDVGIFALDDQEIEPIIDLISVPGDALLDVPDEEIPPAARDLHDSALSYHQVMPEMFTAVNKGGAMASMPFTDGLEAAAASNLSAQREIRETCPSLVEGMESAGEAGDQINLSNALTAPGSLHPDLLQDMDPEGLRALSFSMLFFIEDEDSQGMDAPSGAASAGEADSEGESVRSGIARIGDPAPDFEMTTFDGEAFRLSEHRGEVVIVNFWGSWCPPCRDEMPAFQHAWESSEDDVIFVGVGSKRDPEDKAIAFADEFGVTYPIGRDTEGGTASDGEITQAYNIIVYPTTYVIDPEGNISAIVMFGMDEDDIAGYIDQARNP